MKKLFKTFLQFGLWIPIDHKSDPLPKTIYRMQVLFWIRKEVFELITRKTKENLKMKCDPNHKDPLSGQYCVKHSAVLDKEGKVVKTTQYRGSISLFKRHAVKGKIKTATQEG